MDDRNKKPILYLILLGPDQINSGGVSNRSR